MSYGCPAEWNEPEEDERERDFEEPVEDDREDDPAYRVNECEKLIGGI